MRLSRLGLVLLLVIAATVGSRAQAPPMLPTSTVRSTNSGTALVSPSVMAGYNFSPGDAGLAKLEVLVLWRGQPSWYATRSTSSSGSATGIRPPGASGSTWMSTATYGNVQLAVSADVSASILVVQGQTFDLRRANVILIDAVDAPSGPVVVDTFRIEAQVPISTGPDILLPVLNAAPDLRAFLRCGVAAPNRIPVLAGLCGKVAP